jgi:polyisoprenoid-binding protein YceI
MPLLLRTTLIPALIALLSFSQIAAAQDEVTLNLAGESKLWVDGTSNQSDWTVYAEEVEGVIALRGNDVTRVRVEVQSGKMTSNRSTIMDRLMHTALKTSQHPTIVFVLTEPAGSSGTGSGTLTMTAKGTLTLAGETQPVEMTVTGQRLDAGRIRFTGSYPLSMSDYGITPPTAMFGALRTGADVVVHFDVVGTPSTETAAQ